MVATAAMVYAQMAPPATAAVQIGFPFQAGTAQLPAGKYTFRETGDGQIQVQGTGGTLYALAIVTSLGRHDKDTDAELVFDKVGGKVLLSEVWFPGREGFLLLATKEAHTHAVVGGSNAHP